METQVKVNGQVIILADTNPLHKIEYCQWKNINTGQIWNIDGSEAEVCFNAELAEHGKITFLAPLLNVKFTIAVSSTSYFLILLEAVA